MDKPLSNDMGPKGSEERAGKETVSSTPNMGNSMSAQPVPDGPMDGTVGHWEGDCHDIKFVKA